MILRLWLIGGTALTVVAWVLVVPLSPPAHQGSMPSAVGDYRAAGLLPAAGEIAMSAAVGHAVFEIPETDVRHAAEEASGSGETGVPAMLPGMMAPPHSQDSAGGDSREAAEMRMPHGDGMPAMGGATAMGEGHGGSTAGGAPAMPGTGERTGEGHGVMPMMPGGEERAGDGHSGAMPGMAADGGHGGGGSAFGLTILGEGSPERVAAAIRGISVGRTVTVRMGEWGYEPASITVRPGEVLRFQVRNEGNIPHEFMIMVQGGMEAVDYRLARADWNLTEHEALFEKPLILPGDTFDIVARIETAGMWMYMCMYPYHMQMGMMGMVLTEGMSMDMGGHAGMGGAGGMKMGGTGGARRNGEGGDHGRAPAGGEQPAKTEKTDMHRGG